MALYVIKQNKQEPLHFMTKKASRENDEEEFYSKFFDRNKRLCGEPLKNTRAKKRKGHASQTESNKRGLAFGSIEKKTHAPKKDALL